MIVPIGLVASVRGREADGGPDGDTWLASLPGLVAELLDELTLTVDGPPWHGVCAIALPVRRSRGGPAVLKISWPHPEAATEHLALRAWAGRGAVRLLAAEPSRFALLLERLDGDRSLEDVDLLEACETVGHLHRLTERPPLPRVDRLTDYAGRVRARLTDEPGSLPRRLVDHAIALTRDLPQHADVDGRLLHTDLHFANSLPFLPGEDRDGTADGWLAIDPKPMNAEVAFAVAPLLWNRWDAAARAHSLRTHLRLRLDVAAEAARADPDRARAWTIVRELDNAWWAARSGDTPRVTRAMAIVKAMQG